MIQIKPSTKPAGIAYPIEEVKEYLRVTGTDQDKTISTLISAAAEMIQRETAVVMLSRSFTGYLDNWSEVINLRLYPVTAVGSVKYYDDNGTLQTVSASDYSLDINTIGPRIHMDTTPNLQDDKLNAIEIAFTAGYADYREVPEDYATLLMMLVEDMFYKRGTFTTGTVSTRHASPHIRNMMLNLSKKTRG